MALRWDFDKDFIGTVDDGDGGICNLYTGNALAIMVSENTEEYGLRWFACDEAHLKNMLADARCREDLAHLHFTFKTSVLDNPKVRTLVKHLAGVARVTLAAPDDVIERQIYTVIYSTPPFAD